jgi:eukaryotic-like serine/threonine-protein kinase
MWGRRRPTLVRSWSLPNRQSNAIASAVRTEDNRTVINMTISVGSVLGHYEIVAQVGSGGMGDVYIAKDLRLKRRVAVKVLAESLTGDLDALSRLQQEAEILAKLGHPNVVTIYDFERADTPYVVMELLEGETLRNRLQQGPIPWRRTLDIGASVAEGLAAAHTQGIIHRDLKPENIFITSSRQVKILDFGIARLNPRHARAGRQEELSTLPNLTAPGDVVGTLAYMSPEQLRAEELDDTSDIFSLGCVIHEMITGSSPFRRGTAAATHSAILFDDPPDIPESVAPREVTQVVSNCLAKEPSDRFQAARDLALTLRGVVPASVLFDRSETSKARIPSWTIATVISLFLVAAIVAIILLKQAAPEHHSIAVLPFENVSNDKNVDYLADGIAETVMNNLSEHRELRVVPRSRAFQFKGKPFDAREIAQKLRVDAVVTGRLRQTGSQIVVQAELIDTVRESQLWGKRFEAPLSGLLDIEQNITADILRKLDIPDRGGDGRLRQTASSEAHRLYLKGRYYWEQRTEPTLREAILQFQAAVTVDPQYALAHAGLADSHILLASYSGGPPVQFFEVAKSEATRALSIDPNLAEAHTSMAAVYEFNFDWPGAEAEYRRALELKPEYMTAHHWYAQLLMVRGRFAAAEKELQHAMEIEPESVKLMLDMATLYLMQRDYARAAATCRAVLARAGTYEVPALETLAFALAKQGKFDEAAGTLEKPRQALPEVARAGLRPRRGEGGGGGHRRETDHRLRAGRSRADAEAPPRRAADPLRPRPRHRLDRPRPRAVRARRDHSAKGALRGAGGDVRERRRASRGDGGAPTPSSS